MALAPRALGGRRGSVLASDLGGKHAAGALVAWALEVALRRNGSLQQASGKLAEGQES